MSTGTGAGRGDSSVRASVRDASWHARPNVNPAEPKQFHVIFDGAAAACDQRMRRLMLDIDGLNIPAEEVPDVARCRRPGCAKRWPNNTSSSEVSG